MRLVQPQPKWRWVTLKVPPAMKMQLDVLAVHERISRSELVRRILQEYIDTHYPHCVEELKSIDEE